MLRECEQCEGLWVDVESFEKISSDCLPDQSNEIPDVFLGSVE